MPTKKGLGKGIGALIPDFDEESPEIQQADIRRVPVEKITTNPYQPRSTFAEEKIEELAASIKEKGVLQPLLVTREDDGYRLIAGERRLRAAYRAGLSMVPVICKDVEPSDMQELALVENIQREDLNAIEEAKAFQKLIKTYSYTQEQLSRRLGKSRTSITNTLRLLKLCAEIQKDLSNQTITMGHARAYLGLDSAAEQKRIHKQVVKGGYSVRQTEEIIKKERNRKKTKKIKKEPNNIINQETEYILNDLRKKFSTKVSVAGSREKGKFIIEYFSREEFERIFELLRN